MPRSRVSLLGWVVAATFVLATLLQLVDELNLVATPPELPETSNMVDRALGSVEYRQSIWPVFLWTNLLFAAGFIAAVAFAAAVASRVDGTPTFRSLATTGGIIGAIASIIPIGAVNGAVWLQYCDCGFKETEIVSQQWAGMVALDIADWFNRVASVVLGIALIALVREAGRFITPLLRTFTYLVAAALLAVPILATIARVGEITQLLAAITGLILIPVWAVWLARSIDRAPDAVAT